MRTAKDTTQDSIINSIIEIASKNQELTVEILKGIKGEKENEKFNKFLNRIGKILGEFIDKENFTESFKSSLINKLESDSEKK